MNSSKINQTNSVHRWCELRAFVAIALVLACFALSPQARALPPRNSTGGHDEPKPKPSPTTCPGFRDCTAWTNSEPKQFHVAFPGPNNMTLHGHIYIPGINTKAQFDALTQPTPSPTPTPRLHVQRVVKSSLPPLSLKFAAVIYNHGSESDPKGVPALAKLYVDHGYVFFAPDRHGQGLSKDAGPYILDLEQSATTGQEHVELHELYNKDVIAAVDWLKQQPYINTQKLIMTGISYGGIQTLLTAEKDPGIAAYLPFTPAAESWGNTALQQRLITAVQNEKAPMFMIQAEGDYNLGPIETLGPILDAKGNKKLWKWKLYPKFGCTNQDAHYRFATNCDGIAIWSPDVLTFLDDVF